MGNESNQEVKGMGRGMWLAFWVGALAFLTYLFQGFLDQQFNPNQDPMASVGPNGVAEVVLARNAKGHYVADGALNGQRVTFLLDTGATDVAVSEALANRIGLERQGGGLSQTANGVVAVWQTTIDSVELGSIRMRNVRASIVPSMRTGDQVLLGMSFLKRLEMIQRDGRLTLRQGGVAG